MSTVDTRRPVVVLNQEGFAEESGWLRIYCFNEESGEYLSTNEEYLTPYGGLPAHSVLIAPPGPKEGFARVYCTEKADWEYLRDHRGEVVYRTDNGMAQKVMATGELPADVTLRPPQTPYDHWNGKRWVTNKAEQHQAEVERVKASLRQRQSIANNAVAPLQDALDLDMATTDEKSALLAWKKYRVLLNRMDISTAPDIDWPTPPDEEA